MLFAFGIIIFLFSFFWVALCLVWPILVILIISDSVGLSAGPLLFHFVTGFLFSKLRSKLVRLTLVIKQYLRDNEAPAWLIDLCENVVEVLNLSVLDRLSILIFAWVTITIVILRRSVVTMWSNILTSLALYVLVYIVGLVLGHHYVMAGIEAFIVLTFGLVYKFIDGLLVNYKAGSHVRRTAFVGLCLKAVLSAYYADVLVSRFVLRTATYKRTKILRSIFAISVKWIEATRLPQMFRNPAELGYSDSEAAEVNGVVDNWLTWLSSLGYPVGSEIHETEPVQGIAGGEFDPAWLIAGTTWRMHLPQLEAFVQPEFRKLFMLGESYMPTTTYQTLHNQLRATSRYFVDANVKLEVTDEMVDIVWDMVKELFENSKITPAWAIYKMWNKKFNVGVYSTDPLSRSKAGKKKLKRRAWISRVTPKGVVSAFQTFIKYGLVFDSHAQFMTKVESIKPSKWLNDKVRTPISMMLPEFVAQMVIAGEPNKRYRWDTTPIKLGMPIKAGTFEAIWKRHARLSKHYAGDCTDFDSTITGGLLKLVKEIRKRGFQWHADSRRISDVIDTIYERVEFAKLVSCNSGNVYLKGSGLATGHASTSSDNSLTTVALYLCAWKELTGRGAAEFRYYNELSAYGDDHVLSIASDAPGSWTWDNITLLFLKWGVTMREEVPSGGKGVPLEALMFLRKVPRRPTKTLDEEFLSVFPGQKTPEWYTLHDRDPLIKKLLSPLTNRDPYYRAKRMQSYMYLCAHRPQEYDLCKRGIAKLFEHYPKVGADLAKFTPTYEKVLICWHTKKMSLDVIESGSDLLDPILGELNDSVVMFGEQGPLESILGLLSKLPDLVSPAIRNIGPVEFIMKQYGHLLSWPKALVVESNNVTTRGHAEALVSSTAYDWLSKTVPWKCDANYTTLLVRHWIYMLFRSDNPRSLSYRITGVFRDLINLNFILTGFVATNRPKFTISYWNLALTAILSSIEVPSVPALEKLARISRLPDIVGFLDDAFSSIQTFIIHRAFPSSFADTRVTKFGGLRESLMRKIIVEAPTGSGKSTDLIYSLYLDLIVGTEKRLIIIVPRVALAEGLSRYLNERFHWVVGHVSGESTLNRDAQVLFITTGVFLHSHGSLFNHANVFVLDEFHLQETETVVCRSILLRADEQVIFPSATPIKLESIPTFLVSTTRSYGYSTERIASPKGVPYGNSFLKTVLDIGRSTNPWMVHLVFVDSFHELDNLAESLPSSVGEISGRRVDYEGKTWILATSAADVGITIPNVDVVIMKSFAYTLGPEGKAVYQLSDSLMTQRAGRTGRTNNGLVYIVDPPPGLEVLPVVTGTNAMSLFDTLCRMAAPIPDSLFQTLIHISGPFPRQIFELLVKHDLPTEGYKVILAKTRFIMAAMISNRKINHPKAKQRLDYIFNDYLQHMKSAGNHVPHPSLVRDYDTNITRGRPGAHYLLQYDWLSVTDRDFEEHYKYYKFATGGAGCLYECWLDEMSFPFVEYGSA